jgi:hypothetical protein
MLFCYLTLLFGCQSKPETIIKLPEEQGRKKLTYVKAIMSGYRAPGEKSVNLLPPPPNAYSYFSVGATFKGDTVKILVGRTIRELVDLSELAGQPTDSITLASLVNGEGLLELNEEAKREAQIIKVSENIDSVKLKGKDYTVNYYFDPSGYQKNTLNASEQNYLVDILSDWGYLIYFDDYIGTYIIRK